jgi:hypothetical protein
MVVCILKALVAWVVLAFVGTNLVGFIVRGLLWTRPSVEAPTDRVAELLARESRRMSMANIAMTALSFLCTAAFLAAIYHFFGLGVLVATAAIMASRLPDLLWEIHTGHRVTLQNAPKGARYVLSNILFWGALPLLWYSLCAQSS